MKAIDVKTSTYIDFDIENNDKNSKFKVGGHQNIRTFMEKVTLRRHIK